MSEENVEIVRRIYGEGLIDRDPKRFVDDFATPDIEYVNPPEAVDPGIRRGRAEVRLALRRARQSSASSCMSFMNCAGQEPMTTPSAERIPRAEGPTTRKPSPCEGNQSRARSAAASGQS
jgi:hypothetical protein